MLACVACFILGGECVHPRPVLFLNIVDERARHARRLRATVLWYTFAQHVALELAQRSLFLPREQLLER